MADPNSIPLVPQDALQILWIGLYVFGGVISLIAAAMVSLAVWVGRRLTSAENRCREENAKVQTARETDAKAHHQATMAFAEASRQVAEALKGLKHEVRDAVDMDTSTPLPQPIISFRELNQPAHRRR